MSLRGLFITATDTGVGKTQVAVAVARILRGQGRRVGVLKPVATGVSRHRGGGASNDQELLLAALGTEVEASRVTPLVFEEPLAPAVAARRQGQPLEHARVLQVVVETIAWWAGRAEVLLVEGIGGLLCPLAEGSTVADLAVALDFPLVIVARRGLGTLNHTLLTVEAARQRGLRLAGLILNAERPPENPVAEATNPGELARRVGPVPLLAVIDHLADLSALSNALESVDWYGRSGLPRGERAESRAPSSREIVA